MTLHTLIIIICAVWGFILFGGLLFVTFILGRSTKKNNPNKAYIFIKNGLNVEKPLKGQLHEIVKTGISYKYGENKTIIVPKKYGEAYYCNRRMLLINHIGQLIALPFKGDNELTDDEKVNLIYAICESHVGSDGMKALKGKSQVNIIVVAVISVIIGAILCFGIIQFQKNMATNQTTTQQQMQKPAQSPIEVK